jgi:predicted DsbA family dithiol-disulfide isomerase
MRIDVIFDTICPWCFIGKKRLERALRQRPGLRVDLRWRPFLLNPDVPDTGMARSAYLERKFGGPGRVGRMLAGLREAGARDGIAFAFESIERTPNTLDSHRLVRMAAETGQAAAMVERLFEAYFLHGRDIGDPDELCALAAEIGMDAAAVRIMLNGSQGRGEIHMENAHTHRMSINGVPCFIFDGAYAIAGAQDPDILLRMIDLACEGSLDAPLSSPRGPMSGPMSGVERQTSGHGG